MSTSINEQQQLDAQISEEAQWNSFNENQSIANENLFDYKKLLLNGLVIVTIFLITINSLLTVWIMFKIGFSWHGIGKLIISQDQIELFGEAHFMDNIYANQLKFFKKNQLKIVSDQEILLKLVDNKDKTINKLTILPSTVQVDSNRISFFNLDDPDFVLKIDEKSVQNNLDKLTLNNVREINFDDSIQTPMVTNTNENDLQLSSLTREISLKCGKKLSLQSTKGKVSIESGKILRIQSKHEKMIINSSNIDLNNLRTVLATRRGRSYPDILSLCCCSNGLLYMTSAKGPCKADAIICTPHN